MTTRRQRGRRIGPRPVQGRRPSASEDMPGPKVRENGAGQPQDPTIAGRRRGGARPIAGFSAEAIPLRPAAERSGDLEREERLRLLTARRVPRLPAIGGRRRVIGVGVAAALAVVVVGGSITLLARGRGPARDAGATRGDLVARRSGAPPHSAPASIPTPRSRNHSFVSTEGTGPRSSGVRRARHDGPGQEKSAAGRRRKGRHGRRRRAHRGAATAASPTAPPEESVPTPVPEPPPERAPAPEPTAGAEPVPEPEPPPPTSTPKDESAQTQEPSTVERQFGFER